MTHPGIALEEPWRSSHSRQTRRSKPSRRHTSGLNAGDRHAKRASSRHQARVIAGQLRQLALGAEKFDGGEMERIQCANLHWERLERSAQREARKFDHFYFSERCTDLLAMRSAKSTRPNPVPNLVLEQLAGHRDLLPERCWRPALLDEQVREDHRAVEIDHQRSSRSRSRSASNCSNV